MIERPDFQGAAEAFLSLPRDASAVARRFAAAYDLGRQHQQLDDAPAWQELRAENDRLRAMLRHSEGE